MGKALRIEEGKAFSVEEEPMVGGEVLRAKVVCVRFDSAIKT